MSIRDLQNAGLCAEDLVQNPPKTLVHGIQSADETVTADRVVEEEEGEVFEGVENGERAGDDGVGPHDSVEAAAGGDGGEGCARVAHTNGFRGVGVNGLPLPPLGDIPWTFETLVAGTLLTESAVLAREIKQLVIEHLWGVVSRGDVV